ncbi:hypothetical protein BY996DRAFT_4577555 [Phakopsora pachyrhizi]|nr:hypothetical protein BY996DRAFT_4577555 [Phakopsora pachyrhizi]
MDVSDRGRPVRNRRKPVLLAASYLQPDPNPRLRNRSELVPADIVPRDSMGRTRQAKSILGALDPNPGYQSVSDQFSRRSTARRNSTTGSRQLPLQQELPQDPSGRPSESDDKDADGEEEVDGDPDYNYGVEDDENEDFEYQYSRAAQSGSDFQVNLTAEPDLSEESLTIRRTLRKRNPTVRLAVESDDSNFEPNQAEVEAQAEDDDDDEDHQEQQQRLQGDRIETEESETHEPQSDDGEYSRPSHSRKRNALRNLARKRAGANGTDGATRRSTRNSNRAVITNGEESDSHVIPNTQEEEEGRQLRSRKHVDYHIPPLNAFEEKGKSRADRSRPKRLPAKMSGKELDLLFGLSRPEPDSDDEPGRAFGASRSNASAGIFGPSAAGTGGFLGSGLLDPGGMAAGPSNLGKVSDSANLADTDPLGVQTSIDFSQVGGMDHHIQQLKEMVSLPLLYPEIFQRFQVTPPRGVLFHGPPGTGKTLLARALAASCSTEGQKISFFMRKGADCLSKWVGEAERQLRLLFEEAKSCQPSIIFFDEIDGLAPVRSSKQEQIHASIVSTLLSLMDGMDGRGQVVIIGATNRPDAVDPALRRPGRFDREFYFPLPNREARLSIINIHTRGWDPPLADSFKAELAELTKGYGGADLRALCTEAALNAVQRSYPQIYSSVDRLVINPSNINVVARDFAIAQKHLIPSTSRSASNTSAPLPQQLLPLLEDFFERAKKTLSRLLPDIKRPNVLEEAKYEEDQAIGFEKERILKSFETLRVFKPRMAVSGPRGCGQSHIGSAILHHLEGYHVQNLDLANLIGDSTIGADARCVQIFAEAKRHKPSVLFIPSLHRWNMPVLENTKATITSLLDEVDASDPILILGIMECQFEELPRDIKSWFGVTKSNRIVLQTPTLDQRSRYFAETIASIRRPPDAFPDGLPKKLRVLEELPKAPPRAPRQPTESELASQLTQDRKLVEYLKFRLGPVLNELKKKHKRFTKPIGNSDSEGLQPQLENGEANGENSPTFFQVDLERMHYKLYYNKYLTSHQFITDVEKIVYNAELESSLSHTSDHDLAVKAQAMLTHTRVMVEQACDPQFDVDCLRMFERMKLRNPKLGEEQKKKETNKTSEVPLRQSARTSGKEPEYLYNPQLNERGIKRLVSISSNHSDTARPSKRSKGAEAASHDSNDEEKIATETPVEAPQELEQLNPPKYIPESTTPDYDPEPIISGNLNEIKTNLNVVDNNRGFVAQESNFQEAVLKVDCTFSNINHSCEKVTTNGLTGQNGDVPTVELRNNSESSISATLPTETASTTVTVEKESNPAEEEDEVAKVFNCPEAMVERLRVDLEKSTEGISLEGLEELRAGMFDTVWRYRKSWDRVEMIEEIERWRDEFLKDFESVGKDDYEEGDETEEVEMCQ